MIMIKTERPALSGNTYGFPQAQQSRGESSMSKPGQTETDTKSLRILLPINAKEDSRWGIQYALHRHREGRNVGVILLNIGEPVTQWQVLRFRTQQEIAQFQADRAQAFIEEATQVLEAAHIPCRGLFRQGKLVFSILDAAEELECNEIVIPDQKRCLSSVFGHSVVSAIRQHQRGIPVIVVKSDGDTV
jgi:hypothetical protein